MKMTFFFLFFFLTRLLLGGDLETQTFFCQAETALFDFHFSCMSEEEMNTFFCKLDKNLCASNSKGGGFLKPTDFKSQDITSIAGFFSNIKQSAGSWKRVTRLYMAQCRTTHFSVPFQSVLDLLGKRQVTLKRGMARVPFCKLREVVKEQFLSLMQLAAQQASQQLPAALADDRLETLWRKLKVGFSLVGGLTVTFSRKSVSICIKIVLIMIIYMYFFICTYGN